MMESECCEVVLNAVFYWEPVEFFQKRCDIVVLCVLMCIVVFCVLMCA